MLKIKYALQKKYFAIKRKRWSTIPSISTKRAITSHLNSLNTEKTMTLEIQFLAWDKDKNVARVFQPFLLYWIANVKYTYIYTNEKTNPAEIHFHSKRPCRCNSNLNFI